MEDRIRSRTPAHPGVILQQKLKQLGCSKAEVSRLIKLSRQTLYDIIAGRQSIGPSVALRIGKLTGTSAEMWLDLQQAYNLAVARQKDAELLATIPALEQPW